jgi:hypothetical protein
MYFSDDALKKLEVEYRTLNKKLEKLFEGYVLRKYQDPRAREHANQGFARRLRIMVRCIDNVFRMLPPDRTELPSRDELSDAAINIQSFVFNVFGSIDNLAWIWVSENAPRVCLARGPGKREH